MGDSDIPSQIAGRYEVESILGRGGMGVVLKAYDPLLGQAVAIKLLTSITDSSTVRFHQEAKATGRLNHENIVRVWDFGVNDDGQLYMVSEYLEGRSLSDLLKERTMLKEEEALPIFAQICRGLAHAHDNGVLHRDLKPSNVMLISEEDGFLAKIIDFGLVKFMSADQAVTATGVGIGSPYYMSPEQIEAREIDRQADIYSFGCLIFKTLSGSAPFEGHTAVDTFQMHLHDSPPSLSQVSENPISPHIEALVYQCLAKEPGNRPANFADVEDLLCQRNSEPEIDDGVSEAARSAVVRQRVLLWSLAMIVVLFLCLTVYFRLFVQSDKVYLGQDMKKTSAYESILKGIDATRFFPNSGGKYNGLNASDEDLKAVSGLKGLKGLGLEASLVEGNGLKYLKGLPITYLNLNHRPIDDADLAFVSDLPELNILYLNDNSGIAGKGFFPLRKLKNLYFLSMTHGKVTGESLEAIAAIKSIKRISFHKSSVDKARLSALGGLELDQLDLSFVGLESPQFLCDLRCRKLTLNGNPGLSGTKLSCLNRIDGLEVLELGECQLTGGDLLQVCKIRRLTDLNIAENKLPPGSLSILSRLSQLSKLNVTREGDEKRFYSDLSRVASLREIIIQNASPGKAAALAQLKYLESLRFKDCAIGESDFLVLAKLPRLKELFFQACTVDGAFVDGLKKLNIKRLVLNRMKISESQIKQLALLKGLSTLELRGLDVSEKLIRYLNNSLPKTSVQAVPGGDNTW